MDNRYEHTRTTKEKGKELNSLLDCMALELVRIRYVEQCESVSKPNHREVSVAKLRAFVAIEAIVNRRGAGACNHDGDSS